MAIGGDNLLANVFNMAEKIVNEDGSSLAIRGCNGPFFAVYSGSCAEKCRELKNAVLSLETANRFRRERRAIEHITRLPKGEVREGEAPFDYVKYYGKDGLWVQLSKFSDKKYPEAVGILYRYDGYVANPGHPNNHSFRTDRIVGYIKKILRPTKYDRFALFESEKNEEYFLVIPKRQIEGQGTLVLEVAKNSRDDKGDEILQILLIEDSYEKVSARFDDLGRL